MHMVDLQFFDIFTSKTHNLESLNSSTIYLHKFLPPRMSWQNWSRYKLNDRNVLREKDPYFC